MAIKSLLLYVDNDPSCRPRCAFAAALAREHEAHLTGAYVPHRIEIPAYASVPIPETVWQATERETAELQSAAQAAFEEAAEGLDSNAQWRVLDDARPEHALSVSGRYVDLLVLAQREADAPGFHAYYRPDDVVLGCGRPVLIVPYSGEFAPPTRHAVVAWDRGREAARAVHDALPLLRRMDRVSVVSIGTGQPESAALDELAAHLVRHGLRVEAHTLTADGISAGDMLLSHAADCGCDLIVMGMYGHSRLRETVLGGMTRHLLEHMTAPVLFSH